MTDAQEIADLLSDRPDLASPLRAVLAVDSESTDWTYDDVAIDSGEFGELVSREVVSRTADGYTIQDRAAVETGLARFDGDTPNAATVSKPLDGIRAVDLWSVDSWTVAPLVGACLFLVATRVVFSIDSVYTGGEIVLSGNDPYYYRYWVEQLLQDPDVTLGSLPGGVTRGEPLYVATVWVLASALGGVAASGWLLAWIPVVSALLSGLLIYAISAEVTEDSRVAVANVLMLAVIAGHGLRTSLGFADHHAFDYIWLGVTAWGLLLGVRTGKGGRWPRWRPLGAVLAVAVGVGGQVLAWEAGPLLIAVIGPVLSLLGIVWVRNGESPLSNAAPILLGLGFAAILAWLAHSQLGWHTTIVAAAPAMLVAGSTVVILACELSHRVTADYRVAAVSLTLSGSLAAAGLAVVLPDLYPTVLRRARASLFRSDGIAEVQGVFTDSAGWLLLFGFALLVAVPYLVWGSWRARTRPVWLVPVVYAWWFLALTVLQVRFVGELAPFIAIFAGLGFVHLAAAVDVCEPPAPFGSTVAGFSGQLPSRRQLGALVVLFVLVGGLGLLQVSIKTHQVTHPDDSVETAAWIDQHAASDRWDQRSPYVLSDWGSNRLYNYFVSGESRSYGFARSNYERYLAGTDEASWYQRFEGRVGYVVYDNDRPAPAAGTIAARLASHTERDTLGALSHHRLVHVSPGGRFLVFAPVTGAKLTGEAEPNRTVQVEATLAVEDGTIAYQRSVDTDRTGAFELRVPYPGTYTVSRQRAVVTEQAVLNGTRTPLRNRG